MVEWRLYGVDVDELAFAVVGVDALDVPAAPEGAPVTTVAGGGASGEVAIYRGVLGSLALDELVVAPVVAPPVGVVGTMPLTGLVGESQARPAAVVKIDNGGPARPQTGLDLADLVVEEEVEGGITRFAAVFHSNSTVVGPVRSARTTDIGVLGGLGSPLLMYSGANRITDTLIRNQAHVQNRSFETSSGYWRADGRRAPSNLYTDTSRHWASAEGGAPSPHFAYRQAGTASASGQPVSELVVAFRGNRVSWVWDGSIWRRSQGGSPHTVASGDRITAANVVVVATEEVATGMVDSSGAQVPEFVFVGTGPASIFTAGVRIDGIWTKPTLGSVATLTAADGTVIELTPGQTWIEMITIGAGMLSSSG